MSDAQFVIVCVDLAGFQHTDQKPPVGQYLASFDAEAHTGLGEATWTHDLSEAMVFPSAKEAFREWQRKPINRPIRDDGGPNRPLTAYSIEIAAVP